MLSDRADRVTLRLRRVAARLLHRGAGPDKPRMLGLDSIAGLGRTELEDACRTLVSPAYFGQNIGLCRILGRYKLYIDTRDTTHAPHLLLDGYWESWITQFIARRVLAGWTVFDVGACYGYYSMLLADLIGPRGHLITIELNPAISQLLRKSIDLNGFAERTTICTAAAGSCGSDFSTLAVPLTSPGQATMQCAPTCSAGSIAVQVPSVTLDSLVKPGQRVDFLKIDAEGSEERIIAGMSAIIETRRPDILLEFDRSHYSEPAAFLAYLTELYGLLAHIEPSGVAAPISSQAVLDHPGVWMLFLSRP